MRAWQGENALMRKFWHFMTVLREPLLFLLYCPVTDICLRRKEIVMKHFLKGVASVVIVLVILFVIRLICNMNGIELNTVSTGTISADSAMLIYHGLIRKEDNKDNQEKR